MDNDVVKSLTWAGLLAAIGALASIVAKRLAGAIYLRVFNEEPLVTVTEPERATEPDNGAEREEREGASAEKSVGELVFEVTEQASILIREEIELAKAEVSEKLTKLLRGSVVGLVAGVLAFLALILAMHGFAWLLNDLFFEGSFWAGFLIESLLFFLAAAGGGFYAYRALRSGAPPTPDMAIEEAREIRSAFDGEPSSALDGKKT